MIENGGSSNPPNPFNGFGDKLKPDPVKGRAFLHSFIHLAVKEKRQSERDEAYLSQAVDIYDLERRMHEIDNRATTLATGLQFGLVLR